MSIKLCKFLLFCFFIFKISPSQAEQTLFTKIENSGINFNNTLVSEPKLNPLDYLYFHNGGGVSIGDINNDGLPDIYFSGNQVLNRLYLNKGNFKFEDITKKAGVGVVGGWSEGVSMMDFNNDGLLDIYVCLAVREDSDLRKNKLFINNGDLTFSEQAKKYGLDDSSHSNQAAYLDYDGDGDMDLYLLNFSTLDHQTLPLETLKYSRDPLVGDKLYRNDGSVFTDVSEQAGILGNPIGYGLGVVVSDFNNDLRPDIYVSNDFQEKDYLYINQGDGTFKDKLIDATGHTSNSSMGVDAADYDNDGFSDIMVLDMSAPDNFRTKTNMSGMNPQKFYWAVDKGFHYQYMINTLQRNTGLEVFSEIAQFAGVARTDWSWSTFFADFNLDGFKDLYITNGLREEFRNSDFTNQYNDYRKRKFEGELVNDVKERAALLKAMKGTKLSNFAFKNEGNLTYVDATKAWGLEVPSFSNGAAYGDLDNDGDLDLVVNNVDEKAFVFRNNAAQKNTNQFLKVKLKGPKKNILGLGSRVELETTNGKQMLEHYMVRGYKSSMSNSLNFGIYASDKIKQVSVTWPDGRREIKKKVDEGNKITFLYLDSTLNNQQQDDDTWLPKFNITFKDITKKTGLSWIHRENKFDDYKVQLLLPHKLSNLGPAAAVADINSDGLDDVFVGGAKGLAGAMFIQTKEGKFVRLATPFLAKDKESEDISALFFDFDQDNDLDLYVASGGYEYRKGSSQLQDRLYLNDGKGGFEKTNKILPTMHESSGVVVGEDFDNDGDVDLFVGSRLVPGEYPQTPTSFLLENRDGVFVDVIKKLAPSLKNAGMVTSAIWSDFSGDGLKDLIVVGEWMPIMMMQNNKNSFADVSKDFGLEQTQGWWQHISEVESEKGKVSYLVGNVGENLKLKASKKEPLGVYLNDFDSNGKQDIVISIVEDGKQYPLRGRQCSSDQIPFIKEKFQNYEAFGNATLQEIFDEDNLESSLSLKSYTMSSALLTQVSKKHFELKELTKEAQTFSLKASAGTISDGFLALAGNHYDTEVETPRIDSGEGLVLDKKMNTFRSIQTGFVAKGKVRHLIPITLAANKSGLLVVRNSGEVIIYEIINNSN